MRIKASTLDVLSGKTNQPKHISMTTRSALYFNLVTISVLRIVV